MDFLFIFQQTKGLIWNVWNHSGQFVIVGSLEIMSQPFLTRKFDYFYFPELHDMPYT